MTQQDMSGGGGATSPIATFESYALALDALTALGEGAFAYVEGCPVLKRRGTMLLPSSIPEAILARSSLILASKIDGIDGSDVASTPDLLCDGTWTGAIGSRPSVIDGAGPNSGRVLRLEQDECLSGDGELLNLARNVSTVAVISVYQRISFSGYPMLFGIYQGGAIRVRWTPRTTYFEIAGRIRSGDSWSNHDYDQDLSSTEWGAYSTALHAHNGTYWETQPREVGVEGVLDTPAILTAPFTAWGDDVADGVYIGKDPSSSHWLNGRLAGQLVLSVPAGETLDPLAFYDAIRWMEYATGVRT